MKGEFCPTPMLCDPTVKLVVEDDCNHCEGTGIQTYSIRAACKPCGGTGKLYDVYHDCSMFAGRDLRGVEREYFCPDHGIRRFPGQRGVGVAICCDKRVLRPTSAEVALQ